MVLLFFLFKGVILVKIGAHLTSLFSEGWLHYQFISQSIFRPILLCVLACGVHGNSSSYWCFSKPFFCCGVQIPACAAWGYKFHDTQLDFLSVLIISTMSPLFSIPQISSLLCFGRHEDSYGTFSKSSMIAPMRNKGEKSCSRNWVHTLRDIFN